LTKLLAVVAVVEVEVEVEVMEGGTAEKMRYTRRVVAAAAGGCGCESEAKR